MGEGIKQSAQQETRETSYRIGTVTDFHLGVKKSSASGYLTLQHLLVPRPLRIRTQ